jgi:hypothetical protein
MTFKESLHYSGRAAGQRRQCSLGIARHDHQQRTSSWIQRFAALFPIAKHLDGNTQRCRKLLSCQAQAPPNHLRREDIFNLEPVAGVFTIT